MLLAALLLQLALFLVIESIWPGTLKMLDDFLWARCPASLQGLLASIPKPHPAVKNWERAPELAFPVLLGWVAAFAGRKLAAAQLSPKLLERFNGEDMRLVRRSAYVERFDWYAGDRRLLCEYEVEEQLLVASIIRSRDNRPHTGVGHILGFISELHDAYQSGLINERTLNNLFRDRFSFYVHFFAQLRTEIQRRQEHLKALGEAQSRIIPFPFVHAPSTVDWLITILALEEYAETGPKRATEEWQWSTQPNQPDSIQGLRRVHDLDYFAVLVDTNLHEVDSILGRRSPPYNSNGQDGFLRLRVRSTLFEPRHLRDESRFMLDAGYPTPGGFFRAVEYIDSDTIARRYYDLFVMQGAIPQNVYNPFAF